MHGAPCPSPSYGEVPPTSSGAQGGLQGEAREEQPGPQSHLWASPGLPPRVPPSQRTLGPSPPLSSRPRPCLVQTQSVTTWLTDSLHMKSRVFLHFSTDFSYFNSVCIPGVLVGLTVLIPPPWDQPSVFFLEWHIWITITGMTVNDRKELSVL